MTRYVNKPFLLDRNWLKQEKMFDCALNSLQQCFYNLTGIKVSESTMLKLKYTNNNGTSHDGITKVVNWFNKQHKQNISIEFRNLSSFGKTPKERWNNIGKLISKPKTCAFAHILYHNGGKECTKDKSKDHGHYEVFDTVNTDTMYIRALNSLSGGYLQDRKISVEECFMNRVSQPSVIVLTKK